MKSIIILLCTIFIVNFKLVTAQTTGGPDTYGYIWTQYRAAQGAKWVEVAHPMREKTIDVTDKIKQNRNIGPINFSFDFPYYWYTHKAFYVNINGYISFNPVTLGTSYNQLPTEGGQGDDYIAALLSPLSFNSPNAKLYYWSNYKDSVVLTWENVPYFVTATQNSGANTFQIILSAPDSSITFNYIKHEGSYNNTPCPGTTPTPPDNIPNCQMIGIENITGKIGLLHSKNNETIFVGISQADPLAIRFTPAKVAQKNYKVKDLAVKWNNNPENGGIFISKDGPPVGMKTNILNQGTDVSPNAQVKGVVKKGATVVSPSSSTALTALEKNESRTVKVNNKIQADDEGIFMFEAEVVYAADEVPSNNKRYQHISVVDTTTPSTTLDYSAGVSNPPGFTFLGAVDYQRGIGVYIEPPYYPVKITALRFGVSGYPNALTPPSSPVRLRIFDDNGTNVFGIKDGTPGDTLFEKDLLPDVDFTNAYNVTSVDEDIQINSGGVYIALMQGGQGVGYMVKTSGPFSYRNYEVNDPGGFVIYRNRTTEDFLLGMDIEKGDVAQVLDLSMDSLVQPGPNSVITDSIEVKVVIRNVGPQPVTGPFDVAYQADTRPEVVEEIPSTVTINVGQTLDYTFKTKCARPPVPKTNYMTFCTRINPPNDFNLDDNKKCYETGATGMNEEFTAGDFDIYPNPAADQMTLAYSLDKISDVQLEIFDLTGTLKAGKILEGLSAGSYHETISLEKLPAGIYVCRLITASGAYSRRIIVVK